MGDLDFEDCINLYKKSFKIAFECDIDCILIETMNDSYETKAAVIAAKENCDLPIFVTNVYDESGKLMTGADADVMVSLLEGRKNDMPEGSYTTYLFSKGIDKILKKVGEECTEVIIAAKADDKAETVYEIADLMYHVMVLMNQMNISVEEIHRELASRHIIDHKVKKIFITGKTAGKTAGKFSIFYYIQI